MDFDEFGAIPISVMIGDALDVNCAVLMGANVANEVAAGDFCEATIGTPDILTAQIFTELFNTPRFRITCTPDVFGVEVCGALKNIVAIGAGFSDGLGYGGNTKAALMRIGLGEMMRFAQFYFKGVQQETFFESCGIADLITTCFGGRNRKCAEAFVKTGKSWEEIETELLGGQKLQGTLTAKEVHVILQRSEKQHLFPFFEAVYQVAYEGLNPEKLVEMDLLVDEATLASAIQKSRL